ncbi:hypothetical protein HG531_000788 [Fusarium graminearum]|nr:hypothetical protein HG531_000788 [Fusarium graminearum]
MSDAHSPRHDAKSHDHRRSTQSASAPPGDVSQLPKGQCRYILTLPELKGHRCGCMGFHHNTSLPGATCYCGHFACFHSPHSIQRTGDDLAVLKKRVKDLEAMLQQKGSYQPESLVCRISDLEETVESNEEESAMQIKALYQNSSAAWEIIEALQERTKTLETYCGLYREQMAATRMNNTVVVSVALLGGLLGSARLGRVRLGSSRLLLFGLILNLTSASLTRSSDVISPNINGKVLQCVAVDDALGGVGLGKSNSISVVLSEVIDSLLADDGDVQDPVEKVGGPESVQLGIGDSVAQIADRVEVAADLEREGADDCLGGGIVASPLDYDLLTVLCSTVLVRVIATEENTSLVSVDNTVVPSNRLRGGGISKVLGEKLRLVSMSQNVVFGMLSKLDSLIQSAGQLMTECRVARLVDGVILGPTL